MQKNVVKINEAQLRGLIKESVKKSIGGYENQYADDKGNLIQSRKDGDGKKHWRTVKDQDYKKEKGGKFNKEKYSDVYGDEHGNHIQSRVDGNGKKHWKVVKKVDENAKMGSVKLTESQLHKLIKESVRKAFVNEISSDMISRASKKFHQKYGGTLFPGPDAKDFPRDEHGNLLYPKDKRTLAQHYRNFNDAYRRAKEDEDLSNPLLKKAQELYDQVDLEQEVSDWTDDYGCDVNLYGEIEDENGSLWKFEGWGAGVNVGGGDIEIDHVEEMNFESPDGETGSVPKP